MKVYPGAIYLNPSNYKIKVKNITSEQKIVFQYFDAKNEVVKSGNPYYFSRETYCFIVDISEFQRNLQFFNFQLMRLPG